jgi:hypothetical protein
LPDGGGPEPGARAIGGAAVEWHADHSHIAVPDLIPSRQ